MLDIGITCADMRVTGAINLTYFLSGQSHGLNIYSEDLCEGTRFLDMAGILTGGPVMNLDFLIVSGLPLHIPFADAQPSA